MRVLFMGTPDFALPSLDLINRNHEVVGVFTKPDKPNKRGNKIIYNPIKQYALENNLKIFQPNNIKTEQIISQIKSLNPDIIVVVAYGNIIPNEIINIPKYKAINLHSSLLPKYRGAAPIHAAIINGDRESGTTVIFINEKLDAGDIILSNKVTIGENDTFLDLHDKLKIVGANLTLKVLDLIENNSISPIKQNNSEASYIKPFKKEDCVIDWSKKELEIFNKVRGMNPFPCAFSRILTDIIKIYEVEPYNKVYPSHKPGEVVDFVKGKGVVIAVGDGSIVITSAKPSNRKILSGQDLINGKFLKKGDIL